MFGHVSFTSIPVDDFGRARGFYAEKLGFEVSVDAPYGEDRWIMLEIPGARTRVHLERRSAETALRPVLPLIAADVPGAIAALRDRGVEIVTEPKPAEWDATTTYAMIRDSEGNLVLIASR